MRHGPLEIDQFGEAQSGYDRVEVVHTHDDAFRISQIHTHDIPTWTAKCVYNWVEVARSDALPIYNSRQTFPHPGQWNEFSACRNSL